jgi:hypothetical protein
VRTAREESDKRGQTPGKGKGALVLVRKFRPNVTTERRVRIRDTYEASRSADEHLCSENGAKLDGQDWRQDVLSEVYYKRNTAGLTWRQEVETEVSR